MPQKAKIKLVRKKGKSVQRPKTSQGRVRTPADKEVRKNHYEKLSDKNQQALIGGGHAQIERQHQMGKLCARERLDDLLDPESFVEIDRLVATRSHHLIAHHKKILGDGVVTGSGKVNGRLVFLYSQDFTALGGSLGEMTAQKICKVIDEAMKIGAPLIGLNDSGGARIQEGVNSLAGYGEIFYRNVMASGVIPQITAVLGPCAGGAVYSPALTDFTFMVKGTSYMFLTGPDVVKAVTHEDVTKEDLGGAEAHDVLTGQVALTADDDRECLSQIRRLLSYLPSNNLGDPPGFPSQDPPDRIIEPLDEWVPVNPKKVYDMKNLIEQVVDRDSFFELYPHYAENIIVGYARMYGKSIGIVANQPLVFAGCLDILASIKAARFIRCCDAFNIPIITFVDVPGFMPGLNQEMSGIIRTGAKLLYAYCEATVPKISVIVRKAYGGAYIVMSSKHVRGDRIFAYPMAEIAVMGPEGAVKIIHRKQIESSEDPELEKERLTEEYRNTYANPYEAAEIGYIEEVIFPRETRFKLIQALDVFKHKRSKNPAKKHGNIPL